MTVGYFLPVPWYTAAAGWMGSWRLLVWCDEWVLPYLPEFSVLASDFSNRAAAPEVGDREIAHEKNIFFGKQSLRPTAAAAAAAGNAIPYARIA